MSSYLTDQALYTQIFILSEAISKIDKSFEARTAQDRNRRYIWKYFEDYDSSRTRRSGYLAFLRWLLVYIIPTKGSNHSGDIETNRMKGISTEVGEDKKSSQSLP